MKIVYRGGEVGATHEKTTSVPLMTAVGGLGASGTEAARIEITADSALSPIMLVATTLKEYVLPLETPDVYVRAVAGKFTRLPVPWSQIT